MQKLKCNRIGNFVNYKNELLKKLSSRTAKIGIIGLGYVGLPLGLTFTRKGFTVIGFDVDETKIPVLNAGKSYIKHINADDIAEAVNSKRFEDHNKGKVESTKLRTPFELIYYEACRNEEDALHREKYSPREIQDIIHQQVLEI